MLSRHGQCSPCFMFECRAAGVALIGTARAASVHRVDGEAATMPVGIGSVADRPVAQDDTCYARAPRPDDGLRHHRALGGCARPGQEHGGIDCHAPKLVAPGSRSATARATAAFRVRWLMIAGAGRPLPQPAAAPSPPMSKAHGRRVMPRSLSSRVTSFSLPRSRGRVGRSATRNSRADDPSTMVKAARSESHREPGTRKAEAAGKMARQHGAGATGLSQQVLAVLEE